MDKGNGAHLWRSTGDIYDGWPNIKMLAHKEMQEMEYNGCGCFNDMDMLVVGMNGSGNVGVGGCTFEEYKTHFSFWAFMGSPLMIGCDIRNMTDETKKILTNKEVLRVDQDAAYRQPFFLNSMPYEPNKDRGPGEAFWSYYPIESPIMARFLDDGEVALGFFNFSLTTNGPDGSRSTISGCRSRQEKRSRRPTCGQAMYGVPKAAYSSLIGLRVTPARSSERRSLT